MEKENSGLELACRFSSITNRLRYCGPKDAYIDFYNLLSGRPYDKTKIREHFSKYEGLYVYLKHMAEKTGRDFLDREIIEAYWLGNSLLEKFNQEDQKTIIMALVERGLPKDYAEILIDRLPTGLNLMHSFNVLYVGVGKTTGAVQTNLITMNKCLILPGKVLKLTERQLIAKMPQLRIEKGILSFSSQETQYLDYRQDFLPGLKVGDVVAAHWDFACKIMSDREEDGLMRYTQQNVDAINMAGIFQVD